jgi:hypothetical protein
MRSTTFRAIPCLRAANGEWLDWKKRYIDYEVEVRPYDTMSAGRGWGVIGTLYNSKACTRANSSVNRALAEAADKRGDFQGRLFNSRIARVCRPPVGV